MIKHAPWFVKNTTTHEDLNIDLLQQIIWEETNVMIKQKIT